MTAPAFQLRPLALGESRLIVHVLQDLLPFCAKERRWLHEDMNCLRAVAAKSAIREWITVYIESLGLGQSSFSSASIAIFNHLLENQNDVGFIALEIDEILRSIAPDLAPAVDQSSMDRLRAQLRGIFREFLDDPFPFPCSSVTIARALAQGIDDAFRGQIELALRASRIVKYASNTPPAFDELTPGELIVNRRSGGSFFALEPAYNPAHAEDDAGQLAHLRRIEQPLPISLSRLDADRSSPIYPWSKLSDCVNSLTPLKLRVGFACLGPMVDETKTNFHVRSKKSVYQWTSRYDHFPGLHGNPARAHSADHIGSFSEVEYYDQAALFSIYQTAVKEGVDLLIYPELVLDAATEKDIVAHFKTIARPMSLVLGSRHVTMTNTSTPTRFNRLHAYTRGTNPGGPVGEYTHDKIGTFGYLEDRCYYVEDVTRPRNLKFIQVDGISIAMLICKDVLQHTVLDALAVLSPQRLIVSAMSLKTDEFAHHFRQFAVRHNTTTFFSCFSGPGQIAAGIFGPGKSTTSIMLKNPEASPAGGGAVAGGSFTNVLPSNLPQLACIELPIGKAPKPGSTAPYADPRFATEQWFELYPASAP